VASAAPWRWNVAEHTLAVRLPDAYRVLSWAPLGGGLRRARLLGNHQVLSSDRAATESPARYLSQVVRELKCGDRGDSIDPADAVMMMTGADIRRVQAACAHHGSIIVQAWCTAGCSNALRVGDPATVEHPAVGTINLIVVLSEPLSPAALAEASQLAVEARVAALFSAGVRSTVSDGFATGTGTDCVIVASPFARSGFRYCGKHTRLGELIGHAALQSCAAALASL
jgi:adenosylcobinamide amidohydrolase